MRVYAYHDSAGNFGDDLNGWLWPRLIPELLGRQDDLLLVGIGTLLDRRVPSRPHKLVFGAGAGYGDRPVLDHRWRFFCLRGPLTAAHLGLPAELAVTDGAALVGHLLPASAVRSGVSFMPHHVSRIRAEVAGLDLRATCERAGVNYLDPCAPVSDLLPRIQQSELVLGEAMHACIVADALRVPWIPVQLYDHILSFKWSDWCQSLQLDYQPFTYPGRPDEAAALAGFLARAARQGHRQRSADTIWRQRIERLRELLEQLRAVVPEGDPSPELTREGQSGRDGDSDWLRTYYRALAEVEQVVPPGARLVLVDEDQWGTAKTLAGRRRFHLLERGGSYAGPPRDGAEAVDALRRRVAAGARYVVFGWPAFWWLGHYPELQQFLSARACLLSSTPRVQIFELDPRPEKVQRGDNG
jgi:succinoglycan biosynthesis protein ExoV